MMKMRKIMMETMEHKQNRLIALHGRKISDENTERVLKNLMEYTENDLDFLLVFSESIIGNLILLNDELRFLNKKGMGLVGLIHKVGPTLEIIGAMDLLERLKHLRSCELDEERKGTCEEIHSLAQQYKDTIESIIEENRTIELVKTA